VQLRIYLDYFWWEKDWCGGDESVEWAILHDMPKFMNAGGCNSMYAMYVQQYVKGMLCGGVKK
jgi:hypothetical protein